MVIKSLSKRGKAKESREHPEWVTVRVEEQLKNNWTEQIDFRDRCLCNQHSTAWNKKREMDWNGKEIEVNCIKFGKKYTVLFNIYIRL